MSLEELLLVLIISNFSKTNCFNNSFLKESDFPPLLDGSNGFSRLDKLGAKDQEQCFKTQTQLICPDLTPKASTTEFSKN